MVIKKIFEGNFDGEVHSDFLKFGRGEFKNRYLIEVKRQADKWAVKTGPEFANFFVNKCLPRGIINIRGVVISTFDLSNSGIEIKKTSNFQGIRKTEIDGEIEAEKILNLMEKYPRCFFALSFKTNNCELKIKPKAPKSAKPGKAGEDIKVDFCSLKTSNSEIVRELLFDVSENFKEVKVSHTIKIDDIIYPKDFQNMKPEEVREMSKRKGVIVREIEIDGKKVIGEEKFLV